MLEILNGAIKKAILDLGFKEVDFSLEHPKDIMHGDYATNTALIVAKQEDKNPTDIAKSIVDLLIKEKIEGIKDISIAGPGFINFSFDRDIFVSELKNIFKNKESWGQVSDLVGKKVLVEHSSPNLFKPFHIGHLMNNTVGESITRLAKSSGADVYTMSFPSDISLGVAKAIFILLDKHGENFNPENVSVLGEAYTEGVKIYDEDKDSQSRIKEIADNLYLGKDSPELNIFNKCKEFNMAYFESITSKLGSHFDSYIYESEAGIVGKEIVTKNTPNVFSESEGAIVYIPDESRKDINTSVFINSQGNPTYEAKDVGLIDLKFKKYNPDISIFITDHEQDSHFRVVLDAVNKIYPEYENKNIHLTHGRMTFKGEKMSSRLGGVPLAEDIIKEILSAIKEKNPDISDESAEMIAVASLKFSILKAMIGKNINFDPESSLSFEGDSGPYLQYTAIRAKSLVEKGNQLGINISFDNEVDETETLERIIVRFPEIVSRSINEWAPHHVVGYLTELAQYFNSWYGQGKIIDEDNQATAYRLGVAKAVEQTLKNGLWILGINTPDKM